MILDGKDVEASSTIDAGVCIVGGGPAGLTLALQFLGTQVSVVLVESGGLRFDERVQGLADGEVYGPQYFPLKESRLRAYGGAAGCWGGVCTPYDRITFETRSWVPHSGWPLDYTEVASRYEDALRLCEADSADGGETVGRFETDRIQWSKVVFGARPGFTPSHTPEIANSSNVRVLLNSTVVELQLHPDGNRMESVRVRCLGGSQYKIQARFFVLATGGIENPRLMLASNRVSRPGIGNENDLVGRYFMEHPRVRDRFRLSQGGKALSSLVQEGVAGTLRFSRLQLAEKVQKADRLLNYQANLSFGYVGQDTPQWEALRRVIYTQLPPWRDFPYILEDRGGRNRLRARDVFTLFRGPIRTAACMVGVGLRVGALRRWLQIVSTVEQPPRPENRIILTHRLDPLGVPLPKVNWSLSEDEERTYLRGLRLILDYLEVLEPGISRRRMEDPDPWPTEVRGTWHHMGTTRMAQNPKQGVVNSDCRVHGVGNLYVAGSSVFPTGGAHSPTLTIIALALRLADHLKALPGLS